VLGLFFLFQNIERMAIVFTINSVHVIHVNGIAAIEPPSTSSTNNLTESEINFGKKNEKSMVKPRISQRKKVLPTEVLSNLENDAEDINSLGLRLEKEQHERKEECRKEIFKDIFINAQRQIPWMKTVFILIATIVMSFVFTTPFSLIPTHNVLHHLGSWYEILFPTVPYYFLAGFYNTFLAGYSMNIGYIKKIRHSVVVSIVGSILALLMCTASYFIWTYALHYQYPVPFIGYVIHFINFPIMWFILWFQFPSKWRQNSMFRRRFKFYIFTLFYGLVIINPVQYCSKAASYVQEFISADYCTHFDCH
jgi:hypothetical protein